MFCKESGAVFYTAYLGCIDEIIKIAVRCKILIALSETNKPLPLLKNMKCILHHSNIGEECLPTSYISVG